MNLRLALLLIFIFSTSCASTIANDRKRAEAYLQIGSAHLQKGNYPLALSNLLESVRLDPRNPVAQNNLGLAYFVRAKYDMARKHLEEAVQLNEKYTDARNNLGRTYTELKMYDRAIRELNAASRDLTYGQPGKVLANLGYAYFQRREFQKAKDNLYEAVKLDRSDCYSLNYYGRSLYELKEFEIAAQALDQAIRLCATQRYEEPYYYSGLSYLKSQKRSEAEARFDEIIKLYPGTEYAKKSKKILERLR